MTQKGSAGVPPAGPPASGRQQTPALQIRARAVAPEVSIRDMLSEMNESTDLTDFSVRSSIESGASVRFQWYIDDRKLQDINRSTGIGGGSLHRGFLARLVSHWIDAPPSERPRLEIPRILEEDLFFIPSPCYVLGLTPDRTSLRCWYTLLVGTSTAELLDSRSGILLFSVEGEESPMVEQFARQVAGLLHLTSTEENGHCFFRRY